MFSLLPGMLAPQYICDVMHYVTPWMNITIANEALSETFEIHKGDISIGVFCKCKFFFAQK